MKPFGFRWTWIVPVLMAVFSVALFLRTAGEKEKVDRERSTLSHVSFDLISIERSLLAVDRALTQIPPVPNGVVAGFLAQGKAALSDIAMYRPYASRPFRRPVQRSVQTLQDTRTGRLPSSILLSPVS